MDTDEKHNSTNDPYARPLQNGESTSSSSNAGKRVFILTKTFHLKQIKEILKLILNYFHLMQIPMKKQKTMNKIKVGQ